MSNIEYTRRSFLKVAGGGVLAAGMTTAQTSPATTTTSLPKGRIGKLEVSRLMLGTNIITHHVHARDLNFVRNLSRHYNSEERVMATFAEAQARGVNTFMTHNDETVVRLFRDFRRRGGKMNWIIAPDPKESREAQVFSVVVQRLVDAGADAFYLHGATGDPLIKRKQFSFLSELVAMMQATGLPTGVGAHDLEVVKACEAAKLSCDFYFKTFHHHKYPTAPEAKDIKGPHAEAPHGYWCSCPEETAEFMKPVTKPWIGFKVMAAGAIPPHNAFQYAYEHGVDFILAGMFDFEIAEDARIVTEVLGGIKNRSRPWHG
ncbi:MAG: hypothetical protein FJ395_11340 [Verrucomicrobia bacterium]|nr:hypothetical protein [Verrucomicrobiota bacterium]